MTLNLNIDLWVTGAVSPYLKCHEENKTVVLGFRAKKYAVSTGTICSRLIYFLEINDLKPAVVVH